MMSFKILKIFSALIWFLYVIFSSMNVSFTVLDGFKGEREREREREHARFSGGDTTIARLDWNIFSRRFDIKTNNCTQIYESILYTLYTCMFWHSAYLIFYKPTLAYTNSHRRTPLEINLICLGNKEIYCIFETYCIIYVLFFTTCRLFHNFILFFSTNSHIFFINHALKDRIKVKHGDMIALTFASTLVLS